MSEHLSPLQLDEIGAGLVPVPEHLAACAECTQRLEFLRTEGAAVLTRPEAKRQLHQLTPAPPRRSFLRLVAIVGPLAAGVVLFMSWPRAPMEDRIKGAPTVMLLDEAGLPVTHAAAGTKLTLAVGAAGFPRVHVFTLDAAGKKEELYAGPAPAGARVPLLQLEVTPGEVTVIAEFERDGERRTARMKLAVP